MTHVQHVATLQDMAGRLDTAVAILTQMTVEAEHRPQWTFLKARLTDLQTRIAGLCDETQLMLYHRAGLFLAPAPIGKKS